jgi:autotransporter-associated beta strand protein
VNLNANTLTTGNGSNQTIGGAISGSGGSLVKRGAGTLELAGANTYTGATTVSAGAVVVTGSLNGTATTVAAGAKFNVSGSVTGPVTVNGVVSGDDIITGTVTANIGGHVSPGTAVDGLSDTAILTASTLTAKTGSVFDVKIAGSMPGTDYDQLVVTNTVSLDADHNGGMTLSLDLSGYTSVDGTLFFLVNNQGAGAVQGTFANPTSTLSLPFGPLPTYQVINFGPNAFAISYQGDVTAGTFTGGNDVVLMAVPEPNSLAMLAGSLGLAVGLQRFRRRRKV